MRRRPDILLVRFQPGPRPLARAVRVGLIPVSAPIRIQNAAARGLLMLKNVLAGAVSCAGMECAEGQSRMQRVRRTVPHHAEIQCAKTAKRMKHAARIAAPATGILFVSRRLVKILETARATVMWAAIQVQEVRA